MTKEELLYSFMMVLVYGIIYLIGALLVVTRCEMMELVLFLVMVLIVVYLVMLNWH